MNTLRAYRRFNEQFLLRLILTLATIGATMLLML